MSSLPEKNVFDLKALAEAAEADAEALELESRIAIASARKIEAAAKIADAESRKFIAQANILLCEARAKQAVTSEGLSESMTDVLIANMHRVYGFTCTVDGYYVTLQWHTSYPYYNVYLLCDDELVLVRSTKTASCVYRVPPVERNTDLSFIVSASHVPDLPMPATISELNALALQLDTRYICCVSDIVTCHVLGPATTVTCRTAACEWDTLSAASGGKKNEWGQGVFSPSNSADSEDTPDEVGQTWHSTLSRCVTAVDASSMWSAALSRGNSVSSPVMNCGILTYLGTRGSSAPYVNPQCLGEVVATFGSQMGDGQLMDPESMDISSFVSNADVELVVCGEHPWMMLALQGWTASITHYSLKLGTADMERICPGAPGHWKVQGSSDGSSWTDLDVREGMEDSFKEPYKVAVFALNVMQQRQQDEDAVTFSSSAAVDDDISLGGFSIPEGGPVISNSADPIVSASYSYFRIVLLQNSCLCLANMELYGTLSPVL